VTTFEPGARLDFTHGLRASPRSTAFFARRPAATMTDGFEVFVQLVIAAMTTEPCSRSKDSPPSETGTVVRSRTAVAAGTGNGAGSFAAS
jgi:hypothetical protein